MAIYRGPGGSGDATGDAANEATLAIAAANAAATSETNAATSASSAATSAANALTSANNAAASAASINPTLFVQKANNLSDLTSASTARTNLGLGTAATTNSTAYATAAQGTTADNSLQKTSNLSDLNSVSTARTNLGVTATGADTTYNYRANNLSDVANAATARTNLGLAIGTNVQAYNAATALTNALQTFTASQRGTVTTDNDLSFDMSVTNNFKCTPTATGALTFTNITAGQSGYVLLVNTSGYAVTAAATTKVNSSFLATVSTAGTYLISYFTDGTNVYVTTGGAMA